MPNNELRPVLFNGELYSKSITKKSGGPGKEPFVTYEQAREKLISDLGTTKEKIDSMPSGSVLPNEFVVCVRVDPGFSAKSYYPDSLFDSSVSRDGFIEIGSRSWRKETPQTTNPEKKNVSQNQLGKMFFVRSTKDALEKIEKKLNSSQSKLSKSFQLDVRKINSINFLTKKELILGFNDEWKSGKLEAALHPFFMDKNLSIPHFLNLLKKLGVDQESVRSKQYEGGLTFVSFNGNVSVVQGLSEYNPLRAIHPLEVRELPVFRGTDLSGSPLPPANKYKSKIVVGVFDGGAKVDNTLLEGFCENEDLVTSPAEDNCVKHGTAVSGAVLFGPLNDYSTKDRLPEPFVNVKSFRVIPTDTKNDYELYDVIDNIEKVVPANKDIKVYNLSLGPCGPILDDNISRFTYSCDLLSAKYGVLFCVAVGNDGMLLENRIQSPSDMVNGLAVGSYTNVKGAIKRAPYSCIGPGREGNKLKPDLTAFGGCDQSPIHLVSTVSGSKNSNAGTSFASPIVAGYAGQLIGRSNGSIDALVARALLIHNSKLPMDKNKNGHCVELGHGILPDNINDIIVCPPSSYTLIYKGELPSSAYAELKIPWIDGLNLKGSTVFNWTVAIISEVDPKTPDDYTKASLRVSFYPNANKYRFEKDKKGQVVDVVKNPEVAEALIKQGWIMPKFPISKSGPSPFLSEDDLRAEMKWDTIDSREIKVNTSHISSPALHINAISRGRNDKGVKTKYALILTVKIPGVGVDFYSKIINHYSLLTPLQLLNVNEVRVDLNT